MTFIAKDDANYIGMKPRSVHDIYMEGQWPFLRLSLEIDNHNHEIINTSYWNPVLLGMFDSYINNVIAPDHLLPYMGKVLVELCFVKFSNDDEQ